MFVYNRLDWDVCVLLGLDSGVIKCEGMINALRLSALRFSLVCVQEETRGHYSCVCCDMKQGRFCVCVRV